MRIWSLHPAHLDRAGLVAAWRETLLAQAVLAGLTRGYRHHPQLLRFQKCEKPLAAIDAYLVGLHDDAVSRGYNFNRAKIMADSGVSVESITNTLQLTVTRGQLEFEWQHLGNKLKKRSPELAQGWLDSQPRPHPIFEVVDGPVESFERL